MLMWATVCVCQMICLRWVYLTVRSIGLFLSFTLENIRVKMLFFAMEKLLQCNTIIAHCCISNSSARQSYWTPTFRRITSFAFSPSHKELDHASYYLRWINLWNNFSEEGYSVPQGENGYV